MRLAQPPASINHEIIAKLNLPSCWGMMYIRFHPPRGLLKQQMRGHPEFNPEGQPQGRSVAVAANLSVDGVPQVQPQLLPLAALVFQPEIVRLV